MKPKQSKTKPAGSIDPTKFYAFPSFKQEAGIGDHLIRKARIAGIILPRHYVGRRAFVKGSDGIEFLLACAENLTPAYSYAKS